MSESSLRVVLAYFKRDIEQDEIRKTLFNGFCWFLVFGVILIGVVYYTGGVYKIGTSNKIR